jgi:hypothetical protein
MERGFDLITVVATHNASGFVSTKIIGVVSRPAIFTLCAIEVQNCFVATQMLRYGQVIPESVRRGYIKGTNIENGSRYLQMLKCDIAQISLDQGLLFL